MQHHSTPPEPFPHNEEPQLRKLGLHTKMVRGVPTLDNEHIVCVKGKTLTPEQAQLLKLIGEKMVEFKLRMRARWTATTGEVEQYEVEEIPAEEKGGDDDEVDDAEMDE